MVLKCVKGKNHFGINPLSTQKGTKEELARELLNVQKIYIPLDAVAIG